MPLMMAPVVIDLAKELMQRNTKVLLSSLSMDQTSAGDKMYGLEKTFCDRILAQEYYFADEGRVMVEHLAALELIRVNRVCHESPEEPL